MRCAKSQKLYNMATVPLQICNDTDRCCKNFIVLYSLVSLLSLHFFFSLLSHSLVPSLFSLYRFPLSSTSPPFTLACRFLATVNAHFGAPFKDKIRPQIELALPVVNQKHLHNRPIIVDCIGREASGENPRRWQRRRWCSINHARSHPRSISPISPRGCRRSHPLPSPLCSPFHSASLWLWVFFFFFGLI